MSLTCHAAGKDAQPQQWGCCAIINVRACSEGRAASRPFDVGTNRYPSGLITVMRLELMGNPTYSAATWPTPA